MASRAADARWHSESGSRMDEDDTGEKPGGSLGSRVRAAQDRRLRGYGKRRRRTGDDEADFQRGKSIAFKLGTDLVAALIVGVGAGILFDEWLGTGPWLMLVGFVLGAAAGILNVYRTAEAAEQARRDRGGN